MKALILAAGRGTRIRSAIGARPKCLISFQGEAILDYQIRGLLAADVDQIGIVLGYEGEQIRRHVQAQYPDERARFTFLRNPIYESTNNIYSVWVARDWLGTSHFLCLNADVLCDPRILLPAVHTIAPISMIVDPEWRDETMKVIMREGRIVRMKKGIPRHEYSGTYIGITTFSSQIAPRFFRSVEKLIFDGKVNEFFNVAVQELADEGVVVGSTSTMGLPWGEVDDPADLAFACQNVFPRLQDVLVPTIFDGSREFRQLGTASSPALVA